MAVALLVASAAFYSVLSNVLRVKPGWQTIEARKPKVPVGEEFVFNFKLGEGDMSPSMEWSNLTNDYTRALERNYWVFSLEDYSGINGLYEMNNNPNIEIKVEKELYKALESIEKAGSRYIYYAPLFEIYKGLCKSEDEISAFEFNPILNERIAEYFKKCVEFSKDSSMINIELTKDGGAILRVSEVYLSFAKENEIENFIDFYYWKNAFILGAVSDELVEKGYRAGIISSVEGFSRALGTGEYAVDKYDLKDGKVVLSESITYEGPKSLAAIHTFPITQWDYQYFYISKDKTVFTPFIDLNTGIDTVSLEEDYSGEIIFDPLIWGMPLR